MGYGCGNVHVALLMRQLNQNSIVILFVIFRSGFSAGSFFYSVCMKCTLFSLHQSSIYSIVYHYNAYAEKRIAERLHSFSENDCRFSQNSFNSYKLAVSVWAIQCNKSQAQFYCSFTFSNVICVYFFYFLY